MAVRVGLRLGFKLRLHYFEFDIWVKIIVRVEFRVPRWLERVLGFLLDLGLWLSLNLALQSEFCLN